MADSLRDQLLAAGFDAPKKEVRKKSKPGTTGPDKRSKNQHSGRKPNRHQTKGKSQKEPGSRGKSEGSNNRKSAGQSVASQQKKAKLDSEAKIEERKKLKAKIKTLIDENKTETWKGETVYRYLVDKKIRELYVAEVLHPKLAAREVAITRYNGETFIVPRDTGLAIKEINPQWSVFNLEKEETTTEQVEGDYADYQVPDDLQW